MEGSTANIQFRQSWNNLVDLPSNLSSLLYNANVSPQEVIIELVASAGDKTYLGWSGMSATAPRVVGVDPVAAKALKLAEKQPVTVNVKLRNFKSSKVALEPELFSDWELVELHAAYIENKLIEQSRCVALNQILVVYPTQTSSVRLRVRDLGTSDHTYALIDPFAEVSIAPKLREPKKRETPKSVSSKTSHSKEEHSHVPALLKRGISLPNELISTAISSDLIPSSYHIHVNSREFAGPFSDIDYVSVSLIAGPGPKPAKIPAEESQKDDSKPQQSERKAIVAKLVRHPAIPADTVGLSEYLASALNVTHKVGYKVVVKAAGTPLPKRPSNYVVHPFTSQSKKSENLTFNSKKELRYSDHLAQVLPEVLAQSPISNFCRLPPMKDLPHGGLLTFKRKDSQDAWIKPFSGKSKTSLKVEIGDEIVQPVSTFETQEQELGMLYGVDDKLEAIEEYATTARNSGIMVYGSSGSGKTHVVKVAAQRLENMGFSTNYIACEAIMNESYEQLCSHIVQWINEAVWNESSLLILDNLDKIFSAEVENTDSSQSNNLTEFFSSQMARVSAQKHSNVVIIVTGSTKESFNKNLTQSQLIEQFISLKAPSKATRTIILEEYLIKSLGCKLTFDMLDIVAETEGFLPNDLKVLSDRIYYECIYRAKGNVNDSATEVSISKDDFQKAISGYVPYSLRGMKLEKSSTTWKEVGGLEEAKRVLLETLEWPTKYAPIFANCPLRLRSGILLYGYPGCGKTLLASAIAGQCGLNFISIKGPEILNKYIGASEQSIRDLFDRAQAAKPCILFFDEFDSIAPKRGHDSTGVTDRVVNQMLTQMDGAEGLDGVYVLAATSRPDLIDSALLRPGRLDKSIICDLPSKADRLDILECVCEKMHLKDDVNLDVIADRTNGFSGADMQGLGYNAYLKAVHEKLNQTEDVAVSKTDNTKEKIEFFQISAKSLKKKGLTLAERTSILQQIEKLHSGTENAQDTKTKDTGESSKVMIGQAHFLESLEETKPSISASERNKLDAIYAEFLTGRDGNMRDGSASNEIGGRTTLA